MRYKMYEFASMNSVLYLPRRLLSGNLEYTEEALLAASNYVVILAEPGGGKTVLMDSFARRLGVSSVTANVFRHVEAGGGNCPLVIDAFDELAKIDQTGIHSLLANAKRANATHLIISSRSSEWDNAATNAFKAYLGAAPLVARLSEFDETEQRIIFNHHVQGEDFDAFRTEVARFNLEALLPNPQFLKLFADAYIESERSFCDKRSIFSQAVERLAKEANIDIAGLRAKFSTNRKVDLSSEIFAKLLLSGAEGISTTEVSESRAYPLLSSLFSEELAAEGILATRLFKPGDSTDHHRPIHKIVAEYCAADYLDKRIADPGDPLTLPKCLAIVAPNSTVRDELRGVLGWMASLGNKSIQVAAIELDPYAVLANGDPSQLEQSSKQLLIKRLKSIEADDPYFRRGDFRRRFSVAGFFTHEVIEEIKPLLAVRSAGHLRDLILELLQGSPAVEDLADCLRHLVLMRNEDQNTRLLASACLLDLANHDHLADLKDLISEASHTSLKVASTIIQTLQIYTFNQRTLADFLKACSTLYPNRQLRDERTVGSRYFVKRFISGLSLATIEPLLDELSKELDCKCGKDVYACECRGGTSKIVGSMLDRYFDLTTPPYDPERIWRWVQNLSFNERKSADQSEAVRVLQENHHLRQQIIAHALGRLEDRDIIIEIKVNKFHWHGHSGIFFQAADYEFIVDLAFKTNNINLWSSFIAGHQYYRSSSDRGADPLRKHMREQALKNPLLMIEWFKSNRLATQLYSNSRMSRSWRNRKKARRRTQEENIRAENITFVRDNRELVEEGRHWGCLKEFARLVLTTPDRIEIEFGDEAIVRKALRNCIDFIAPDIPDLAKLAELRCESQSLYIEMILYAACLEIMRAGNDLQNINTKLLIALRTGTQIHYTAVLDEERTALKAEIDRLVLSNPVSSENFLRQYVEPQLARPSCINPDVWLLQREKIFNHLRSKLSVEWLGRFNDITLEPLDTLFEIAAQYGNRAELQKIILDRCAVFMSTWPATTGIDEIERKRTFWLVRAWYFMDSIPETYWDWLKADRETLLLLHGRSQRIKYDGHSYWPRLSSVKIEAILDAFIDKWPKVNLPNNWGSGSPKEEVAYRFLTEVIWSLSEDDSDSAIPVIKRLLTDEHFADMHKDLKSIYAVQVRKKALSDFEPPTPHDVVRRLDHDAVVTVEGLRQLVIQELENFQKTLDGGEFNSAARFYENGKHLDEVRATQIIAERLNLRLEPQGITVTPEHQMKNANRSDFTATKMIAGRRRLLVAEVKGQWHKDLFTAASSQLYDRYSIHPDAEQQGIFLAIWFGSSEAVAGRKRHGIDTARELKEKIELCLPQEITGLIDVFVLDVSMPCAKATPHASAPNGKPLSFAVPNSARQGKSHQ